MFSIQISKKIPENVSFGHSQSYIVEAPKEYTGDTHGLVDLVQQGCHIWRTGCLVNVCVHHKLEACRRLVEVKLVLVGPQVK